MSLMFSSVCFLCAVVAVLSAALTLVVLQWYNRRRGQKALSYVSSLLKPCSDEKGFDLSQVAQSGVLGEIVKTVENSQVDLVGFLKVLAVDVDRQAIGTANISFFIDRLVESIQEQSQRSERIAVVAEQMASTTTTIAGSASTAGAAAEQTSKNCVDGMQAVDELIVNFDEMGNTVESVASALSVLQQQSKDVQGIADVINSIAEQTNLLALNAAIEAARAGEAGRGFSVVADEVRGLASQTTKATSEIATMLTENHGQSEKAAQIMADLVKNMDTTVVKVKNTGQTLESIAEQAERSDSEMRRIIESMNEHVTSSNEVSEAVELISEELSRSEEASRQASLDGLVLAEMAESIIGRLGRYDLGMLHDQVRSVAMSVALEIGQIFEDAIASNRLSSDDIFDRDYKPIEGCNPAKFSTRFDGFTDSVLPPIQEPVVERFKEILFAGAVDNNGYFPTHNKCYSQPLTGDYKTDLVNNRTKRIFNDRTGSRCGSNTYPSLLQTYKRDTGEVIHDLSAPIYVNGRHWGGFRIGYKTAH